MFIVAVHRDNEKDVISVCDENIIGNEYNEGRKQLKLDDPFYKGEQKDEKELDDIVKSAYILHFTGKQSVEYGLRKDLINPECVITISGIPHAQVLLENRPSQ